MSEREAALLKTWEEFDERLPEEINIPKAGLSGEDIILKKDWIDGILTYAADLDSPKDKFQYVQSGLAEE